MVPAEIIRAAIAYTKRRSRARALAAPLVILSEASPSRSLQKSES